MKTGTTATGFYYYRDSVAVEMNTGESIVDNLTHAYIITDSDNTAQDLNAAESNFNTTTQKIIIWMHFWKSPSGSIDTVYVKFNDNLTDQEAEDLVNYYFYETMKNWVPEEVLNPESVPVAVREGINSGESRLGNCSLSWKWGYNCLLPEVNDWYPGFRFQAGMAIGLLDGLLGTIQTIYEGGKKAVNTGAGWWERAVSYTKEVVSYGIRNRSMLKMFKKVGADTAEKLKESWDAIVNLYKTVKEFINTVASNFKPIVKGLWEGIVEWLGGAIDGEAGPGYDVGVLAFDGIRPPHPTFPIKWGRVIFGKKNEQDRSVIAYSALAYQRSDACRLLPSSGHKVRDVSDVVEVRVPAFRGRKFHRTVQR